ncbi:MAG: hypothetical protein NTW80_13010 [Deltaproteobacteria bacterium]|nr:hypothetical protein [Deltaproteobacteria bacterium]
MRAELLNLTGLLAVKYHADRDCFSVRYESVLVSLDNILAAVTAAGEKMGRDYVPEVCSEPPNDTSCHKAPA